MRNKICIVWLDSLASESVGVSWPVLLEGSESVSDPWVVAGGVVKNCLGALDSYTPPVPSSLRIHRRPRGSRNICILHGPNTGSSYCTAKFAMPLW